MFKFVAILVVLAVAVNARPQLQKADATTPIAIISQSQDLDGLGAFNYAFESADGVKEEANGQLKTIKVPKVDKATGQVVGEEEGQGVVQRGSYSYTAPDGQLIEVSYIADENVSSIVAVSRNR